MSEPHFKMFRAVQQIVVTSSLKCTAHDEAITKAIRIHPLENMIVCTRDGLTNIAIPGATASRMATNAQ